MQLPLIEVDEVASGSAETAMVRRAKKPSLSRYSAVAQKLLDEDDPNRVFVAIDLDSHTSPADLTVVDLFSGAGGISQGFKQAGYNIEMAVEIVPVAAETHRHNFPETEVFTGDIGEFDAKESLKNSKINIVIGGPPCQGFSVAGKRDPNDPRNRLFREFVRVVDELKPDYFVMENVPGILTMTNGKVREAILEAFAEIGYDSVSIAVLDSASYGVAQFRSRAIFIGNKHGLPNPFPLNTHDANNFVPIESQIADLPDWERIPSINHEWTNHSQKFIERISKVPPGGSLYETFADAYKRQYLGVPSMTIKENHGGTHIHPTLNRCISAREMARLQSFPDDFYFTGGMKKAMWQIGNAVPPRLAQAIALALKPTLEALNSGVPAEKLKSKVSQKANSRLF